MNPTPQTYCPHCGRDVLPRAASAAGVPRTAGPMQRSIVHVENKGEKNAAGKPVRRAKVVSSIDFYRSLP